MKQRKKFELIPSIKYTLIFDERVDKEELDKLEKGPQGAATEVDPLLAEIAEEEKIGELVAKQDERNEALTGEEGSGTANHHAAAHVLPSFAASG